MEVRGMIDDSCAVREQPEQWVWLCRECVKASAPEVAYSPPISPSAPASLGQLVIVLGDSRIFFLRLSGGCQVGEASALMGASTVTLCF